MGTPSTIGILRADGSVDTIYCHYDGYVSHQGPRLLGGYNTLELAEALVAQGDLSVLGKPDASAGAERVGGDRSSAHWPSFDAAPRSEYTYLFTSDGWRVWTPDWIAHAAEGGLLQELMEAQYPELLPANVLTRNRAAALALACR